MNFTDSTGLGVSHRNRQYFIGNHLGGQSARRAVAPVEFALTPTRKVTSFAVVHLILCRRVRRCNLSAKGCLPCSRPPDDCL
ncbi:MAG: hypothetical protein LBK82_16295, partial [Planctomycetaceae bacterium]|jgi:hypothetical protein|nr:hypothetical protein [Planctomycetaceae bacterium]